MSERKITLEVLCLMHELRPSELADVLHVSRALVTLWFKGTRRPSAERLQGIADLIDEPEEEVRKAFNLNALPQLMVPLLESAAPRSESYPPTQQPVAVA